MSYLRSSQSYIWNTSAVLGKGATGAVYAGLHKATGDSVAVKSFNQLSHMRPYEVQKREFEVLKKVNHENIVKLLAIEEEVESQHKVLVMELCTGGSLFNILDDPVNCHGLDETEFLLVMKHLAAGMKHLRDNSIMHRDLKPGNIMKFIGEDGYSIYKLTDFGAARELEDDQQFQSLYGTEEYLHPDMYERAVLRKPASKTFKANFDLWSIGVTLFHIATGSLPFKPYGGRKNKETMYKITTQKKSGIICGIQHSENGDIEWSRNLPKTCLLSPAAQQLVTNLLAGLMECQPQNMWSFEKFFSTVTDILSHRVYHIFSVNNMKDVVIYLPPQESLIDLKNRLKNIFNSTVDKQLLLWDNREVSDLRDVTTSIDKPVILLSLDIMKMKQSPIKTAVSPKFPDLRINITNTDQDAQLAKLSSSQAFCVQRSVSRCVLYYQWARSTPHQVTSFIQSNVTLLFEKRTACYHFFNSIQTQYDYLVATSSNLTKFAELQEDRSGSLSALTKEATQRLTQLKGFWNALSRQMDPMGGKVKELSDKWAGERLWSADACMETAVAKSKHFCQKVKDSWQTLHKDKTNRILSSNEEQLHQLEKIKIANNCKKLTSLLSNSSFKSLDDVTEKLEEWYNVAQVAIVNSHVYFKELENFMAKCEQLQQCLNDIKEQEARMWKSLIDTSGRNGDMNNGNMTIPEIEELSSVFLSCNDQNVSLPPHLLQEIRRLREARGKLWSALEENDSVISEFESLSTDSTPAL